MVPVDRALMPLDITQEVRELEEGKEVGEHVIAVVPPAAH